MKKFLAVAMSVAMVFGVAACSSSDKTTDTKNEETTTDGEGNRYRRWSSQNGNKCRLPSLRVL